MASFSLFFSLLCLFSNLYHTQSSSISPFSLLLPITKDHSTLQYITTLSYGTPLVPTNLVLDLGGPLLWLHCASSSSSSLLTIPHRSIQCLTAKSHDFEAHTWLSYQDQQQPCQILPHNTITGTKATEGTLVEDLLALQMGPTKDFLFTCSPSMLLNGLASGARGMIGLGRSRTSFTSQVFDSFTIQRKITLCLSSSSGIVSFGSIIIPYEPEILKSLTFTPLVTNPSQEYFINVNSIKISGKEVSFNTPSMSFTQLSSIVPYTTMQSSIYANFESAYLKAALSLNMTRVPSVSPFGLCFISQVGSKVPVIDLVLQSEMVKWSIYGRNSMVRVSDEVMCLGFLDGGENPRNSIVIGGYQLEDVLLQFDFDTSMIGFSSSLLMRHTSCSDLKSGSISAQSV